MVGLGTLINVACIAAGGLVGLLCRGAITQRLQQALLRSCGVAVMFVGIAGTLEKMLTTSLAADGTIALTSGGTMLMVVCLGVGTILAEALDLDTRFPERVFRAVSNSWYPEDWSEDGAWMRIFRNARVNFK